ncbi:XRE family transcriptional regulator [Microbacterium sp.]|uniref:helix-turn-helix domain-containing protein n=1 Tax=Microbacterium sp. TaxID=51671 RepID=UPI0025D6CF64|nr:XRE family transcriptional regulator [Microbacterium sp.]MBT9605971.1 helix-turn-helix domain-containing protein [Microbacterium sp.]
MTGTAPQDDAALLAAVGPRLRVLREARGLTLGDLAERTGISTSTLSRLETGQRRPSLELLFPLARVFRVPLDDLVGAPETGDPRVRLRPRRVNGRTIVPLAHRPGLPHAWKIVIPQGFSAPHLKVHDGVEWLYVLTGRVRLIVGDRDMVLGAGEVAEFDTRTPHWFGSDGDQDAEVLSIFGPQGERVHIAAETDP